MFLVARCVHFLRQHLVGKRIAKIQAVDDNNVFGKVGTSGSAFEKALKGRTVSRLTVVNADQVLSPSRSRQLVVKANISGFSSTRLHTP